MISFSEGGGQTYPDYCAWSCLVVCGSIDPICQPYCDTMPGPRCLESVNNLTIQEPEPEGPF